MQYFEIMKKIRIKNKKTQQWTAEQLKIQQQQYFDYERGKHEINIRYLKKFCEIMKCSADEILQIGPYKKPEDETSSGEADIPQ